MNFKEYWRKNSRTTLLVLLAFIAIGFGSVYFFGGDYSDSFIWMGIVGVVILVLVIGSIVDYFKRHKNP